MVYIKLDSCSTRLGNWMFFYAAAKSAAKGGKVAFVIDGRQDMECVKKYSCLWPDVEYVRQAPVGESVMVGTFQDEKYLDFKLVRDLYQCPEDLERQINVKYGEWLNNDKLVSIHVRRGDYLRLPHRHPFVGKQYLSEAVKRFHSIRGQHAIQFLVFSDDISWCRRFFTERRFPGCEFHFVEGNSVLMDLFTMTKCRGGHICSNSSFSWWGAYLGEGRTIFPSMWYGMAIKGVDWKGLYFDRCEVVTNGYTMGLWLKAKMLMAKATLGNIARKVGLK